MLDPGDQVALEEPRLVISTSPSRDLSTLGFFALCQVATQHVTVALCGQGADEVLGGYQSHRNAAAARFARGPLRGAAVLASRIGPTSIRRAASVVGAPDRGGRGSSGRLDAIDEEGRLRLYSRPSRPLPRRLRGGDFAASSSAGMLGLPLQDTLFLSAKLALVDDMLHYFDRASMGCSLEVRPPFLDHQLVEWCARVPDRLKVDNRFRGKALLRRVAPDLLPAWIVDQWKVGFFSGSVSAWFAGQSTGSLADWLLQPDPAYAELLDRKEVERLVAGAAGGNSRDENDLLLALLMLEIWISSVRPRALAGARPDGATDPSGTS